MITSFRKISMSAGREFRSTGTPLLSGSDVAVPVNAPHKRTTRPHRREHPATPPQRRIPEPAPTRRAPEPVRTAPPAPVPVRKEPIPA